MHFDFYDEEALYQIISRSSHILGFKIDNDGAKELAKRSRGTPRIANRLLRRVRDFAQVSGLDTITKESADQALISLEVDHKGLDRIDRTILLAIIQKYNGGPVGLETIAASVGEDSGTIEDVYEPFLMQRGLIQRTPRGRVVTPLGYQHLGISQPNKQSEQTDLFEA
jgi:Holliday junction DNA helicase RuvB